jgi:hypothetical protein
MVAMPQARTHMPPVRRARSLKLRLLLSMAAVAICSVRPADGSPGDIFSVGAPVVGAEAPKAVALQEGDTSVSGQTGAYQYSYPIKVPPGRNSMQPGLALSYSSQGSIYGGVAAGWSLSIPIITEDTTKGRLWSQVISVSIKNYVSSMAGGRPLIPVNEPPASNVRSSFRAQNDSSFVRYQLMNASAVGFQWRAFGKDGTTYFFGDSDHIGNCTIVSDGWAPLTRAVDSFGNSIDYLYGAGVDSECRIQHIRWGQNANAGLEAFAGVDFGYDPSFPSCNGAAVGAQTSHRTGSKIVTGASKLDSLTITAFSPDDTVLHHRLITLRYGTDDARCTAPHAAFRSLASIQESAWATCHSETGDPSRD